MIRVHVGPQNATYQETNLNTPFLLYLLLLTLILFPFSSDTLLYSYICPLEAYTHVLRMQANILAMLSMK